MSETSTPTRFLSIQTPLPATSFGVEGLSGEEALSRPFRYTVRLHSGQDLLDANTLLDKSVTLTVGATGTGRYVNGIVSSVTQLPSQSKTVWSYQLTVVPKLWFLEQTSDCRFFQKMSVPDIVTSILGDFNVAFSKKLSGSYAARDYVVQFNESYLHFIQRLLADAGIFYFFTHEDGSHTMVLADANSAFPNINSPNVYLDEANTGYGVLNSWQRIDSTVLGSVRRDDYDPATNSLTPGTITGSENTVLTASAASQRKHYLWPAVRGTSGDAQTLSKSRMQAAEATAQRYGGDGTLLDIFAGGKFTLVNDPTANSGGYVISAISYDITDPDDNAGSGGHSTVSTRIVAFPAATTYQEEQLFAPPVMAGLYSAIVIGPGGEEIYTDDLGRIQVQFPADHMGDITTDKTLWVRVLRGWAGNAWGTQYIPRIGMEVAVAFLEGDVNRPVVVGCLFNTDNKPVFTVAQKNKSGLRTRSTTQGSTSTFSEFSVDDTKGSELVYLHAEKDLTEEVENDHSVSVTKDETVKIDGKKTDTVKGDHALTVSEGNHSITVSQGNHSATISQGNHSTTVSTGNETLSVNTGSITHSAGQSITLKVGGNSIVINMEGITLTAGGSSIQLTPAQVNISGIQIAISGSAQTSVSGAIVQVSGDGMLELTGAVTMINS